MDDLHDEFGSSARWRTLRMGADSLSSLSLRHGPGRVRGTDADRGPTFQEEGKGCIDRARNQTFGTRPCSPCLPAGGITSFGRIGLGRDLWIDRHHAGASDALGRILLGQAILLARGGQLAAISGKPGPYVFLFLAFPAGELPCANCASNDATRCSRLRTSWRSSGSRGMTA